MSISAPTDGAWNNRSRDTSPRNIGGEFPAGYTPELFTEGQAGMDPSSTERGKSRVRNMLERFRLRSPKREQPAPAMVESQNTFTSQREEASEKSSSTHSRPRVIYQPVSRENIAIINRVNSAEGETAPLPIRRNLVLEQSDEESICLTEFSDTGPTETFPTIVSRSINEDEAGYHHHGYDSMDDRIYDGTFEPKLRPPLGRGKLETRSTPGLASTAVMRPSTRNKRSSVETAGTKTTMSSHSSSPGLAATAFMRSSSGTTQRSRETPATSTTSSKKTTTPAKKKKPQHKSKSKKREPERVGKQELVPSYEELFG
ncbi:hypothetical protein FQN54_005976 [Arachnomyces sp. PD_36]|nr:hypothetical protein FQN54_005976 [Arachnomyces sp. PD_36]